MPAETQSGVDAIAAGNDHSLALKDGEVIAWGSNEYGQTTVPAEARSGVDAIAAGAWVSLALKDGKVIVFGQHSAEQSTVPAEAQSGVTALDGGVYTALAVKNGGVIAWGDNYFGQTTVPAEAQSGVDDVAMRHLPQPGAQGRQGHRLGRQPLQPDHRAHRGPVRSLGDLRRMSGTAWR